VKWWRSMRVDLQGIPGGYFIDWESALGVMTGYRTLLEYQNARFSSRMRRVFIEQCLWFPNWGFSADFASRGSCFRVFGSSEVPGFVWKQWISHLQAEGNHHNTSIEIKILYLLPKAKHP
jgi:hypothetical protein